MNIAIITGASSGMGKEFARQLTEKVLGLDEVWLIARRSERLASLAKELPVEVRTFSMDLTDDADYKPLTELLGKEQPKVRVMINCAGYGKTGPFETIPEADTLGMIDLNCRALTKMTYLVLPYMPKRSYLIQFASIAGILPQPNFAVYAASKAYVLSLTRALREELRSRQIFVTAICPGPVDTAFFSIAEEKVVAKALHDAMRKKDVSVYGMSMKLLRILVKYVPQKWILYIYARLLRGVK